MEEEIDPMWRQQKLAVALSYDPFEDKDSQLQPKYHKMSYAYEKK